MKLHVNEPNSHLYEVIDKDTDKVIKGVQYADDENGIYVVLLFNNNDPEAGVAYCKHCNQSLIETREGNIEIKLPKNLSK